MITSLRVPILTNQLPIVILIGMHTCAMVVCYSNNDYCSMTEAAGSGRATKVEATQYGGYTGPEAMYVKLISSDDHEFIIKREHALTSGTIKSMLSGPG